MVAVPLRDIFYIAAGDPCTAHCSLFASNRLDLYGKTNVKCTSSFFTFYLIPQLCRFFVALRGDEIRKFAFHLR